MMKLYNSEKIFQNQSCLNYSENCSNQVVQCTWIKAQHIGLYSCVHFLHNLLSHQSLGVCVLFLSRRSSFTSSLNVISSCGYIWLLWQTCLRLALLSLEASVQQEHHGIGQKVLCIDLGLLDGAERVGFIALSLQMTQGCFVCGEGWWRNRLGVALGVRTGKRSSCHFQCSDPDKTLIFSTELCGPPSMVSVQYWAPLLCFMIKAHACSLRWLSFVVGMFLFLQWNEEFGTFESS